MQPYPQSNPLRILAEIKQRGGSRMTEEKFLEKLKALKDVKGLSDLERLLDLQYREKTQQTRRGR